MPRKVTDRFAVIKVFVMPSRHRLSNDPWAEQRALEVQRDALAEMKAVLPRLLNDYELDFDWEIETQAVYEHCRMRWTESNAAYNGGCCDKDEEHNPEIAGNLSRNPA